MQNFHHWCEETKWNEYTFICSFPPSNLVPEEHSMKWLYPKLLDDYFKGMYDGDSSASILK